MEWIECIRLLLAAGTSQRGAELSLEYGLHEAIVAAYVIRQRLGSNDLV